MSTAPAQAPDAPEPWLMGPGKAASRARVAVVVLSNVVLLAVAWPLSPH